MAIYIESYVHDYAMYLCSMMLCQDNLLRGGCTSLSTTLPALTPKLSKISLSSSDSNIQDVTELLDGTLALTHIEYVRIYSVRSYIQIVMTTFMVQGEKQITPQEEEIAAVLRQHIRLCRLPFQQVDLS